MKKAILECCVDSVESAAAAKRGGADRIELCSGLPIGGLSPSVALFREIRETAEDLRIHVLLRPRGGDFCYTDEEFAVIRREVTLFRELSADAVVIGILKPDGSLDKERMAELIALAGDMDVTLHRAFDMARDPFETLEDAVSLGINTILTSGQANTAEAGAELLSELVKRAAGRIEVMPGSGVNSKNLLPLMKATGASAFHATGKITVPSLMEFRKEGVSMGAAGMDEYGIFRTDETEIRKLREILDTHTDESVLRK